MSSEKNSFHFYINTGTENSHILLIRLDPEDKRNFDKIRKKFNNLFKIKLKYWRCLVENELFAAVEGLSLQQIQNLHPAISEKHHCEIKKIAKERFDYIKDMTPYWNKNTKTLIVNLGKRKPSPFQHDFNDWLTNNQISLDYSIKTKLAILGRIASITGLEESDLPKIFRKKLEEPPQELVASFNDNKCLNSNEKFKQLTQRTLYYTKEGNYYLELIEEEKEAKGNKSRQLYKQLNRLFNIYNVQVSLKRFYGGTAVYLNIKANKNLGAVLDN